MWRERFVYDDDDDDDDNDDDGDETAGREISGAQMSDYVRGAEADLSSAPRLCGDSSLL